ncbi:MAG: 4-(cytidine 5'-diphospho)-2-C-methyl-D-erythritol kinase [Sphingomicrobium sp.]
MSGLAETAYAKLNLALHVREKQPDGYHRIETIFAFCEDGDQLSAEHSATPSLKISGEFAGGLRSVDNLVDRAAAALREASGMREGAAIHLQKRLPVASGIGGGSADAAATLRLLSRLWNLPVPIEQLEEIARTLGADVAACTRSESVRGTGRGDILEPIDLGIGGTPVLLINPRVELSTAEVFGRWDGADRGELEDWRQGRNDLEAAATAMAPQIGGILAWLSAQRGANCVRMSGSGATCFALFDSDAARDHAAIAVPREWWSLATRLR